MEKYCCLFLISLLFCLSTKTDLDKALWQVGANRVELERVIGYYQNDTKDSLKLFVAECLMENMEADYGYSR